MRHVLMISLAVLSLLPIVPAFAQSPVVPVAANMTIVVQLTASPRNELEFRASLGHYGNLSLLTSKWAEINALNGDIRNFAMLEKAEQTAIAAVLHDLATPVLPLTAADQEMMAKIKTTPVGDKFDRTYMEGQLVTHEKMLALTESYLNNANPQSLNVAEKEAQHLATIAVTTIREHIKKAKDLLGTIK